MDVSDTMCNSNQKKFQFLTLKFSFVFFTLLVLSACDSGGSSGGGGGLPPERSTKETTRALCSDKIDNDSNGKIDCEDTQCLKTSICSANKKVEAVDLWGDYWDGVPRVVQTYAVAEQACKDIGARLPTATELYRNQVKANTSALMISDEYIASGKDGSEKLWTSVERENAADQFTVNLLAVTPKPANNRVYVDVAAKTDSKEYRCIWPKYEAHKLGFDDNHCNGPADTERCFKVNSNLNMDVEPRAPLDYVGAAYECRLEGASIPVVADYANAIPKGLPNGSTNWEYTGNAVSWINATSFGVSLVRFDDKRAAHWSYDRIIPESAGRTSGLNVQENVRFRCIGLASHQRPVPSTPVCTNGNCFHYNNGRSHIIADADDRDPTSYPFAINRCRSLGAELPNQAEFSELIHAGWIGTGKYLWLSDPVIKTSGTANSRGNAVGKWLDVGTINWLYSGNATDPTNADMRKPDTIQSYRCVWHGRIGKLPKCATNQAIQRNADSFACINTVNGDAKNNAAPAGKPKFDIRGNAWDFNNRTKADFATATAKCSELGARLPTANEVYVARANAPAFGIADPADTKVNIWALNPATATGTHTVGDIIDGIASSQVDTTQQFYRCLWEATRSNVLSDRACNGKEGGPAGSQCYQVKVDSSGIESDNDELIADAEDRVAMTMPSARAECQQAGGKLPDMREFSQLTHNSWPNGSNSYLWIDESINWNNTGNYGYALGRWLNNGTPAWQYDNTLYGSQDAATGTHKFRCVYSTVVR